MKNRSIIASLTPYQLFTTVSLFGIILFLAFGFFKGADLFDWISLRNAPGQHFKDYFEHVIFVADPKNLYSRATGEWGTFPPFVYLLYLFLFRLTCRDGWIPDNRFEYMDADYTLTVFLFYSVFVTLLLVYAVSIWRGGTHSKLLLICLLLSVPFFGGGMERGNSVMIVMPLLLIALKWRNCESKWLREFALLLMAICVGIKIYPAVFGLLYLRERRWKEALRLTIYGILVFFLPFFCFGGLEGMSLWMGNMRATLAMTPDIGRVEYIRGLASSVWYLLTGNYSLYLARVIPSLFLIAMLVFAALSANTYRVVFYLCCLITFFPFNAHRYTLSYLAIPFVMYLTEQGDRHVDRWSGFLALCYAMIFSIPTLWGWATDFRLHLKIYIYATYVELWMYGFAYILMLAVSIHGIAEMKKTGKINPAMGGRLTLGRDKNKPAPQGR